LKIAGYIKPPALSEGSVIGTFWCSRFLTALSGSYISSLRLCRRWCDL